MAATTAAMGKSRGQERGQEPRPPRQRRPGPAAAARQREQAEEAGQQPFAGLPAAAGADQSLTSPALRPRAWVLIYRPFTVRALASPKPWDRGRMPPSACGIICGDGGELADDRARPTNTNARMAFAEIALGQIKALRQPATPRNYEIWYAYATGYHPSLNQKINETLQARARSPTPTSTKSTTTYLSPARLSERIDNVGSKVMGEIEQVMAMIDAAAGSANSYTESLADMTEKLGQSKDREGLRADRRRAWCRPPRRWKSPTSGSKRV